MQDVLASPYYCALNARLWHRVATMHEDAAAASTTDGHRILARNARAAALDKARFWADAEQRVSRG